MANEFNEYGGALVANGYPIIPIRQGGKNPSIDEWEQEYITDPEVYETSLSNRQYGGGQGVGVITGVGDCPVVAIDIDTTNGILAGRLVDWCEEHFGITAVRIGNAPKILLVYRSQGITRKITGPFYEDSEGGRHRVEILSKGQQFVAYAIHPDTHAPYKWVDMLGGLTEIPAEALPEITESQARSVVEKFEQLAVTVGLKPRSATQTLPNTDDPFAGLAGPLGKSIEEIKDIIQWHDSEVYDTWLQVGMALHHECSGSLEGLDLWDEWSQAASNYQNRDDLENRWRGFGRRGSGPAVTLRSLIAFANMKKQEAERDEHRQVREKLKATITQCADSFDLMGPISAQIGDQVNNNPALRAEMFGLIKHQFKKLTGQNVPISDIRKAARGGSPGMAQIAGPRRRERTEFGNAERMLDRYGRNLMFVPELGLWHRWNENHWAPCNGVELEHMAKEAIRSLPTEVDDMESDDDREAFYKFCALSQKAQMVKNMVSLASSDPRVAVPFKELNKNHYQLGVANGFVDLQTGELFAPNPKLRITVATQAQYDTEIQAPLFEQTVSDVFFNDAEMVAFFQRLIGYAILGDPKEDILVIPYGNGSNGKSTVLGAIREALGDHAKTANADTFLSDGHSSNGAGAAREDILRLRGARFVYVSEPDEGNELKEGVVKAMTGGDPLPARGMWSKATVEVLPTWCTFMPTNHKPIIKGDDHAIWRRLLPIPFVRNFDIDDTVTKDPERASKLRTELDGILTWCIQGALAYQEQGLNPPQAVQTARDSYRDDMDLLRDWLEDCCEIGDGYFETTGVLWASWERYARERGDLSYIRNSRALGRRLTTRFTPTKLSGKRGYAGLCLKPDGDFEDVG